MLSRNQLEVHTFTSKAMNQAVNPAGGGGMVENRRKEVKTSDSTNQATWLTTREAVNLIGISVRGFHNAREAGRYTCRQVNGNGGKQYEVLLSSLPPEAQARYWQEQIAQADTLPVDDKELEEKAYAEAPEYARKQADKYLSILKVTDGMKGQALKDFVQEWNRGRAKEDQTSYPSIMRMRKTYKEEGVAGLLAGYGKTRGTTTVEPRWMEYFKSVFLKQTGPSLKNCWVQTLGFARKLDSTITKDSFPSHEAFRRLLFASMPEDAIYLARYGYDAWNRKYGAHIDRDLSKVKAGEVWFSDHRQLDILLTLPNGKQARPWVTVWRDMRTSRWMSWYLHIEDPNADHVFHSFHMAAKVWGIPTMIYIDNGKDYRAKDFAGGRRTVKVNIEEEKTRSMMALLGINVKFAKPYGSQTKTLERDFRDLAGWFDKNAVGYTGANPNEKPQGLKAEVKAGKLLPWNDDFVSLFGYWVEEVLHTMPCAGKVLAGRTRNQVWSEEFAGLQRVSEDALKLYCMRVSGVKSISRNGVTENRKENLYYWAEWMSPMKKVRVYLRRDPLAYQTAWVFKAETDEYLGKATLTAWKTAALAETNLERDELRAMLKQKRADRKVAESYLDNLNTPSLSEKLHNMATGARALSGDDAPPPLPPDPKIVRLTPMDEVGKQQRERRSTGTYMVDALIESDATEKQKPKLWEDE
ncbi:MAG: DDE-type integrase/transposase/recombinase [Ignavibacteriae bacterium]|nr:DDE-type integrase/transposase/recombinase [Ignavibacteriota bacterium]MCB9216115.1 DDE-type integrase/transposase/recombinase [Ignavibacteria bacterium]